MLYYLHKYTHTYILQTYSHLENEMLFKFAMKFPKKKTKTIYPVTTTTTMGRGRKRE